MNWDDVKIFLAVELEGSIPMAAATLRINATTVARRLQRLESHFGGKLFIDHRGDKILSPLGSELIGKAREFRIQANAMERLSDSLSDEPIGRVRVSATSPVARHIIAPALQPFHKLYPKICLDLTVQNDVVDLANMDAEIALRMSQPESGPLVARKVGHLTHAIYQSAKHPRTENWIGFSSVLAGSKDVQKFEASLSPSAIVMRSNDPMIMADMVSNGTGIAVLPCRLGDRDSRLTKIKAMSRPLPIWLVMKEDLAQIPVIRSTADWLAETIKSATLDLESDDS